MSFISSRCAHEVFYNINYILDPLEFLQSLELPLYSFIEKRFLQNNNIKFQLHLKLEFIKNTISEEDIEDVRKIIYIATNYIELYYYGHITRKIEEAFTEILDRIENLEMEGSGFTLSEIEFMDCHVISITQNLLYFI